MSETRFKITKAKVRILGIFVIVLGLWFSGTITMFYNWIVKGDIPDMGMGSITVGALLTAIGPWIVKSSGVLK